MRYLKKTANEHHMLGVKMLLRNPPERPTNLIGIQDNVPAFSRYLNIWICDF